MTNPTQPLMKICTSCGEKKPLSAFAQLPGLGGMHGSICHTCRQAGFDKHKGKADADDGTTVQTGRTIDSKSKVDMDTKHEEAVHEVEEAYYEEREETELNLIKQEEKKVEKAHEERAHREAKAEKAKPLDAKASLKQQAIETLAQEHALQTDTSLNKGPVDFGRVAQVRFTQSPLFSSFKAWLGGNAPIIGHVEKAAAAEKHAQQSSLSKEGLLSSKPTAPDNPLVDYIENTWKPGSGKKK